MLIGSRILNYSATSQGGIDNIHHVTTLLFINKLVVSYPVVCTSTVMNGNSQNTWTFKHTKVNYLESINKFLVIPYLMAALSASVL